MSKGHTPTETAYDLAITHLRAVYIGATGELIELTNSERKAVRKAIATLHNRLLRMSGLDGQELEDNSDRR